MPETGMIYLGLSLLSDFLSSLTEEEKLLLSLFYPRSQFCPSQALREFALSVISLLVYSISSFLLGMEMNKHHPKYSTT